MKWPQKDTKEKDKNGLKDVFIIFALCLGVLVAMKKVLPKKTKKPVPRN